MKKLIPMILLCGIVTFCGCGNSQENFAFTNNVSASPVARPDSYTTVQDTTLVITSLTGVLLNDTLNASSQSNVSVSFPTVTEQGGSLSQGGNDGAFTYTPAPGFVGSDSFTYTLSNGFSSSTATVTISVTAAPVTPGFFVNSAGGDDGTASFESGAPFATVQAAVAAAGPNADIVIIAGRGNYTGTVTLQNGQRLLGRASSVVSAQASSPPTLSGPIILADNNTLDFLRVARTNGIAIDGDGQNSGIITNCQVADTTFMGTGIQIRGIRGNWTIQGNTISNAGGIGLDMDTQNSDTAVIRVLGNTISGSNGFGIGMAAIGASGLKVQVKDNVLSDNLMNFGTVALSSGTSTLCLQMLGNQNDRVYRFSRLAETAAIVVEQFAELESLNVGTVFNAEPTRPITDEDPGFCGF